MTDFKDFKVEEKHIPALVTLIGTKHYKWSSICGQCGLLPSETKLIQSDPKCFLAGDDAYLKDGLTKWCGISPGDEDHNSYPLLSILIKALRSQVVGEGVLAQKISEKWREIRDGTLQEKNKKQSNGASSHSTNNPQPPQPVQVASKQTTPTLVTPSPGQLPATIDSDLAVKAFSSQRTRLLNLVKNNLQSLANGDLYAKSIITEDVKDTVCNENIGKIRRAGALLDCIKSKIDAVPSDFREVVRILRSDPFLETIGDDLVHAYCEPKQKDKIPPKCQIPSQSPNPPLGDAKQQSVSPRSLGTINKPTTTKGPSHQVEADSSIHNDADHGDATGSSDTFSPQYEPVGIEELSEGDQRYIVPLLGLEDVHRKGITGQGIRLAIIERGCHKDHESLDGIEIKSSFLVNDDIPKTEHGTMTVGVAAGKPFEYLRDGKVFEFPGGVAPDAKVTLFCTYYDWDCSIYKVLKQISEDDKPYDVVSISIGSDTKVSDSTENKIRKVVDEITKRGTVIFVASGNIGNRGDVLFPAYLTSVISVAALDCGANLLSSARKKGVDIYCYGEVIAPSSGEVSLKGDRGSSLATPAAAGLACLALQCAKKHNLDHFRNDNGEVFKLRHKDKMVKMIDKLMQARGKENVLEPADFLLEAFEKPEAFNKL